MASRNPATAAAKAESRKISQVGDFKRRLGGVFELPSGMVVKLKNPGGMNAFIKAKIIPNSLMGVIKQNVDKGTNPDMTEIMNKDGGFDDEILNDMTALMDNIATMCVVEPDVQPTPGVDDERDDELLYADELSDEDKAFIFQWVSGGTTDLETFRAGHKKSMAAVSAEQGAKAPAKRSPRANKG